MSGKPKWLLVVFGTVHVVVTAMLLLVSLGLARMGPMLTGHPTMGAVLASRMGVDADWLNAALIGCLATNYAVFIVVAIIAGWRLIRARLAVGVVVGGCTLQVLLLGLTASLAG